MTENDLNKLFLAGIIMGGIAGVFIGWILFNSPKQTLTLSDYLNRLTMCQQTYVDPLHSCSRERMEYSAKFYELKMN